jgi:hypothetical protein
MSRPTASPNWRWRTFPVLAAFVGGLLVGSFAEGSPDSDFEIGVRVIALFGAAYVVIHLIVMNVIVAGRIKRRDAANTSGNDSNGEYEDVVVYPGESHDE